ncbi:MAG TPA: hypothetical protein VJH22_05190 [Candidatus Nanoarchaeia archaeon]|nr:hypothetical protein [Candidatus Nanoarchaeia archaeon]
MDGENSGLLIAALVAIVAVVGLVILFKGGAQGAAVCPPGQAAVVVQDTSSLLCVDQSRMEDMEVAFARPVGHAAEWKQWEYPSSGGY